MTRMTRVGSRTRAGGTKVSEVGPGEEAKDLKAPRKPGKGKKRVNEELIVKEEEISFENATVSFGLDDYEELVAQDEARKNKLENNLQDENLQDEEEDEDFDDDIADQDFEVIDDEDEDEDEDEEGDRYRQRNRVGKGDRVGEGGRVGKGDSVRVGEGEGDSVRVGEGDVDGVRGREEEEDEDDDDDDDDDDDEYDEIDVKGEGEGGSDSNMKNGKKIFKCAHCGYNFTRKSMLKRHLRIHTGERPYECEKCGVRFTQQGGLKNHMLSRHSDDLDQKDRVTYQCHHCDRSFIIKERLRIHLRVHTGELPYICHICSKKFRRNGALLQHLRRHVGMRPYSCEICSASYYNSTNLKTHMKRHLGVQDYVCDLCGKGFTRRDGLRKHVACFHYDQAAFRCSICNKSFKGHILSHLRMHLKEKPFKCDECGMRFVQSSQLVVHKRTHTGVKPYQCQICSVAFSHSSALRMHIRRHTGEKPVKCLLCPAAFVQLPHLKKHMRCIHKTEKPYVCVPCYVFFKTKVELEEHVATNNCKPSLPPAATPSGAKSPVQGETPEDASIPRVEAAMPREASSTADGPSSKKNAKRKVDKVIKEKLPSAKRTKQIENNTDAEVDCLNKNEPLCTTAKANKTLSPEMNTENTVANNASSKDPKSKTSGKGEISRRFSTRIARSRARSESPPRVSLVTLPICSPLKAIDQPQRSLVEKMMEKVTNRLKNQGKGKNTVVMRSQAMSLEKIRMLLAILLIRISTPDRLKALGFGKILIDEVLIASIISSGRQPCDKTGLSEREIILKNVQILLDWTVPKIYMERFRRENRSTEDLLQELTT